METIYIKKGHERRLHDGHLWIFSNELESIPRLNPGETVEIQSRHGDNFGIGFYNPHSLIAVRLLLTNNNIDETFFIERIEQALAYRQLLLKDEKIFRLVYGESDFLPGLIIDKYEDYLSLQFLSAGMELHKETIISALLKVLPGTKGIIEKNLSKTRELEGLPLYEKVVYGSIPEEFITHENNIKLAISLTEGQKTGYFLDQKINRSFIKSISNGLKVLDCYANQGGFALSAADGGALKVIGIDSSEPAMQRARRNAEINEFSNIEFITSDVVDFLQKEIEKNGKWDLIILDPPAFAKSKKNVYAARTGYAKINKLAMRLLNEGGFLATSSCSQHISEDLFEQIIYKEAANQRRRLKLVYRGMQAPDHPVLTSMPETKYLKFFVYQVL